MKQLIAANWKMHGETHWAQKASQLAQILTSGTQKRADLLICPPAFLIPAMAEAAKDTPIMIGAQNCHDQTGGAYTGEMSAAMCGDAGASYVILGHSERREYNAESSAHVQAKARAAHQAGLVSIICIGEKLSQREEGKAEEVTASQLHASLPESATAINTVIAYEPIWAIGTGKVPSEPDIAAIHAHLRKELAERLGEKTAKGIALLYGGSVKPANAAQILALPNVDGALVGGASLEMDSFIEIANAARAV